MTINGTLTENEKKLLSRLYNDGKERPKQYTHQNERFFDIVVTRKSDREFDLEIKGKAENIRTKADRYGITGKDGKVTYVEQPVGQRTEFGFESWMPLAVIHELGDWGAWVPDWSMIRDAEKADQWRMFNQTIKAKRLV